MRAASTTLLVDAFPWLKLHARVHDQPSPFLLLGAVRRCCLCFIPLCKVGGDALFSKCERCGSRMPAHAATRQANFMPLSTPHASA